MIHLNGQSTVIGTSKYLFNCTSEHSCHSSRLLLRIICVRFRSDILKMRVEDCIVSLRLIVANACGTKLVAQKFIAIVRYTVFLLFTMMAQKVRLGSGHNNKRN